MVYTVGPKEVHFFDKRWMKGEGWYRSHFPLRSRMPDGAVTGEATPYYFFHPAVPSRVAQTLDDVRLVVLLRDPVERAFSHYRHAVRTGREKLSFEDALDAEEKRLAGEHRKLVTVPGYYSFAHQWYSYQSRGLYAEQLERWWESFDRQRLLVLKAEDLFDDPAATMTRVLEFLGMPPRDLGLLPHRNRGDGETIRPDTRAELQRFFDPHNQRLYRLLGWDLGW